MAIGTNLTVIFVAIAITLWMIGYTSPLGELVFINEQTGEVSVSNIRNMIGATIGISMVTGIIATVFTGEKTYGLFATIGTWLLSFVALPISFFVDATIPTSIRVMIGATLGTMYLFAILSWFRGSEI